MRTFNTLVVLLVIVLSSSMIYAQQTINGSIVHDGIEREFILYIPDSYSSGTETPLLLNYHGFGSSAEEQMFYGDFRSIADTAGFIIAHPQGTLFNGLAHWNVGGWTIGSTVDDVGFTSALIDSLAMDYSIDLSRIYATGMSNGGFMSFLLACQLSDRMAAIASVTGSMTPETYTYCQPVHPTAIMQIHGTSDFVVPYGGAEFSEPIEDVINYWVNYNNCNPDPSIINLPDTDPNDGSTVTHYIYDSGDEGVHTEHFKVNGGGHTWPGSVFGGAGTNNDMDASVEIWKFLSRYQYVHPTGISGEDWLVKQFHCYPNPTRSTLKLKVKNLEGSMDYVLYNLMGVRLQQGEITSSNLQIDLSVLPADLYILKIGGQHLKVMKVE